ncbi:hypothetical protein CDD80_5703 [Ophiocordyceps camponoti-rufipedis]|uniref:Uncharacterized protein n=1 Tax=Ophiocordyceps camponoti-rufipedis TaxID=2004952 RepID=A0A2C5YSY3_9HYPO|nr:hypothetical protein CDD80_5703 [Ophiocordyceps camponoti-rufipedis]
MSRPPSPVSSCPLRRLQVQVGPDTSVYQASQFVGGMTLTFDGQPSTATGRYCLTLFVRCAQRNMLSIRLSELLQHPQGPTDSVSVDRDALQLTIKVPSQQHEIRAAFEHGRDFSLSVCMLNRSGFTIGQVSNPPIDPFLKFSQENFINPHDGTGPTPRLTTETTHKPGGETPISHEAQDFRRLMPQRRHLPFAREDAIGASRVDKADRARVTSAPELHNSASAQAERSHERRAQTGARGRPPSDEPGTHGDTVQRRGADASSRPMITRKTPDYVQHTVLLADPMMLRQLSSLTSGLLEQFQADVSRGCDEGLCAQFYLERLQRHRREFWLSRLMAADAQETAVLAPNHAEV